MPNSNFIRNDAVVADDWTLVNLPAAEEIIRKQAGKVVQFKLTGEASASPEQVAGTIIPASGKIIVPLAVWLAASELGIWLETHELVESLIDDLAHNSIDINAFAVIGVHFERAGDGRGYSTAALLRTCYGYKNELRAFGDILRDQLFFLKRCGFDGFQIRADRSAEEALASLKDFSEPYQGAVDNSLPIWRRFNRGAI
jgi:uncharacterized protein (DUF934 family)